MVLLVAWLLSLLLLLYCCCSLLLLLLLLLLLFLSRRRGFSSSELLLRDERPATPVSSSTWDWFAEYIGSCSSVSLSPLLMPLLLLLPMSEAAVVAGLGDIVVLAFKLLVQGSGGDPDVSGLPPWPWVDDNAELLESLAARESGCSSSGVCCSSTSGVEPRVKPRMMLAMEGGGMISLARLKDLSLSQPEGCCCCCCGCCCGCWCEGGELMVSIKAWY